ncbi:hypothetical protein RSAG8_09469, partial [Rhizoctonia solani AG-8 WAC10335]
MIISGMILRPGSGQSNHCLLTQLGVPFPVSLLR